MDRTKQRLALETEHAGLLAKVDAFVDVDGPTEEQKADCDANLEKARGLQADIGRLKAAQDLERIEPAVASKATGIEVGEPNAGKDGMRGFHSDVDFAWAVRNAYTPEAGPADPRLAKMHLLEAALAPGRADAVGYTGPLAQPSTPHQSFGSATGDGFMVPPDMAASIYKIVLSDINLLGLTNPSETSSNAVDLIRDETTPWGTTGIQANWGNEGASLTESQLKTEPSRVVLHKLHCYVTASDEVMDDAPLLRGRLIEGAGRALAWDAGEAIMNGTGAGQPLGFVHTDASSVSQAKESGQAADTIVALNVLKMDSRLLTHNDGADRLVVFANRDTLPQLGTMSIGNEPSWLRQDQGLQGPFEGTLGGKPIMFTEHCDTVGDLNDIIFANLGGYFSVIKRGGIKFASSIHLFFNYDSMAFRWTTRIGGQPYLSAAVTPDKSSITKSHFVTLAARA